MGGIVSLLYGTLVYMLFLATFLYAIAFVSFGDSHAPRTTPAPS